MPKIHFTKANLESLAIQEKTYALRDRTTPGLFIRISPGGTKTFTLFKKVSGRVVRVKIGRFGEVTIEAARKRASVLLGQMVAGLRPHELIREKRQELTFRQLFDRYYNEHALPHTKRPKDNKASLELHILPKIGSSKIGDITKAKMREIHRSIGEYSGKGSANRMLDMASTVFNYGIKEEHYSGKNPCIGIKRFKRKSRDRFLNKGELLAFFEALNNEDVIYQDFFKICLFTGARKTTVLSMKFEQLEFDLKRWRLSEELSKNGDTNVYALSDVALEILTRRKADNKLSPSSSAFVFPGSGAAGHLKDPKKAFGRIKKRMDVKDIRIHDLRRTLGSYMAIGNVSLPIIGKALNHKSQASTTIYARVSQDPVLEAVNAASKLMQFG